MKQKRKTKNELKNELLRPLQVIHMHKNEELYQQADQEKSHEEAIPVVQDYEKIIVSK